ncbi:hypothetical protein H1C71_008026, partial [Ictidomys tridecemlineatus]
WPGWRQPGKGPVFLKPAPSGPGGGAQQMSGFGSQGLEPDAEMRPATHFPIKHSENICTAFQGFSRTNCLDYCVKLRTGTFPRCWMKVKRSLLIRLKTFFSSCVILP